MDVAGKLVVVTGASQGIGAATAQHLAGLGARVVLMARTKSKLDAVAERARSRGGSAHVFPADLSDHTSVMAVCEQVMSELGVPDVVINNAGAGRWLAVDETPPEEVQSMMGAPFLAAFYVTRAFLPAMIERNSGLLVSVQSPVSRVVWPGATGYAASRWALRGFTEGLRADLRTTNLTVCEAVFGEVTSEYFANNAGAHERLPKIAKMIPVSSPEDVARWLETCIRREPKRFYRPHMVGAFVGLLGIAPTMVSYLVQSTGWKR